MRNIMSFITIPWTSADSKSALTSYLADKDVAVKLETHDANTWGFFKLPIGKFLQVGYADLGLLPVATVVNDRLLVGIDELLAGYDSSTLEQVFLYRMPSIFHEFVSLSDPLIVRDEVGFVGISLDGTERWKYLTNGPIDDFEIVGNRIRATTIDGETFTFPLLDDF